MGRRNRKGERTDTGGIIGLAQFAQDHAEALEYDLLTRTNYTLDDVGGRLSWSALSSFVRNLGTDSALARDLGKSTDWETLITTNSILADIYDVLQAINTNIVALGGGKKKKIKPYPRPGKDNDKKRKFGTPMPTVEGLREWIRSKQNGK